MYIGRKSDGTIYGAWSCKQPNDADHPGIEEVSDNHPDLIAFLTPKSKPIKTTDDKLAAVGLTISDLKIALAK